jgi:hypothetical protein
MNAMKQILWTKPALEVAFSLMAFGCGILFYAPGIPSFAHGAAC